MSDRPEERIAQFSDVTREQIGELLQKNDIVTISIMYDKYAWGEATKQVYRKRKSSTYEDGIEWCSIIAGFCCCESEKHLGDNITDLLHGIDYIHHVKISPAVCGLVNVEFEDGTAFLMWDKSDYGKEGFEYVRKRRTRKA